MNKTNDNSFLFVCFSLISLVVVRSHIIMCLVSLELIVLSFLLMMMILCSMFLCSFYIYVFFMVFCVCEGVLGLGILVSVIRFHGNDCLNSLVLW